MCMQAESEAQKVAEMPSVAEIGELRNLSALTPPTSPSHSYALGQATNALLPLLHYNDVGRVWGVWK